MNEFTWYNPNYTIPKCANPGLLAGETGNCADTQWWFWLTAAVIVALGVTSK